MQPRPTSPGRRSTSHSKGRRSVSEYPPHLEGCLECFESLRGPISAVGLIAPLGRSSTVEPCWENRDPALPTSQPGNWRCLERTSPRSRLGDRGPSKDKWPLH